MSREDGGVVRVGGSDVKERSMRGWILTAVVAVVLALAVHVQAEHLTLMPEARPAEPASPSLDLRFRIGDGGFRMGARILGESGIYGAWLNGHVRPEGFTLDGRVQNPSGGHNFTLDSRTLESLLREATRGLPGFATGPTSSHRFENGTGATSSRGFETGAP